MIDETLGELKNSMAKAHDALRRELSRIRTGRATPDLLDSLRVDNYGQPTPISQMASVSIPEARMLMIKPWTRGRSAPSRRPSRPRRWGSRRRTTAR